MELKLNISSIASKSLRRSAYAKFRFGVALSMLETDRLKASP